MPTRKQVRPDEKLPLKLTAAERKLVLDELTCLEQEIEQVVRSTPTGQPVRMTLEDLDDFGGHVAAEANHCKDKSKAKKLDAIFEKIQALLDEFTDEEPPKTLKIEDTRKEKLISDQAAQIAQFAALARVAAEQLGIKTKALDGFWLTPAQREVLSLVPGVTKALKKKLAQDGSTFSVGEVANMTLALAEDLPDGDAREQVAVMYIAKHLMDHLQSGIMVQAKLKLTKKPKGRSKATAALYQFKITLLGLKPPIWRRIQVQHCTLDKLHEHIQTAMGWTNSHLHEFEIKGQRYGDPELLDDGFDDFECADSTTTMLSEILPKTGKRFAFKYEYDFGDSWEHEVLFEGNPTADPKVKYPLCVEGERACPPEDCGGIGGYGDFLEAICDPKHKEHESMLEWVGGGFDPEAFDPKRATKEMKKGLPDWRSMDDGF
jgi:hypothetical protein